MAVFFSCPFNEGPSPARAAFTARCVLSMVKEVVKLIDNSRTEVRGSGASAVAGKGQLLLALEPRRPRGRPVGLALAGEGHQPGGRGTPTPHQQVPLGWELEGTSLL